MKEQDLYEPMRNWLKKYLESKYKNKRIIVEDTHSQRLDRVLLKYDIINSLATGIDIEIDVLGIVWTGETYKLFFVEAKIKPLVLKDLGQLWAYCKLIDPEEAFLLSPLGLGTLGTILKTYHREDLLDFGDGRKVKKMKVAMWDGSSESPDFLNIVPNL